MTIPPDYLLPENRPAEFYYSIHKAVIEEEHDHYLSNSQLYFRW